jgi:hypothetical protein
VTTTTTDEFPVVWPVRFLALLEAQQLEHQQETAKLTMQLILYRQLLIDNGIEPPDQSGEDLLQMWKECRHVISTANQFVMKLGSSKELLAQWD